MGALKPYEVVDPSGVVTTLMLTEADAKARGLTTETVTVPVVAEVPVEAVAKARTPANKARVVTEDK